MDLLLAKKWKPEDDPTGYWMSEKLDGVRALWDGQNFISRGGNVFYAPDWFKAGFPKGIRLDGELWAGRKKFNDTVSCVRRDLGGDLWKEIRYMAFDIPDMKEIFEYRMKALILMKIEYLESVNQVKCLSLDHLFENLEMIESKGGEGLMLREPGSYYEGRRSYTLLKVKSFHDDEAIVTGIAPGKGKHLGRLGALECKMPNGKSFNVGTGFSDEEREVEYPIGTEITYRYFELTRDGIPRFPSFIRVKVKE